MENNKKTNGLDYKLMTEKLEIWEEKLLKNDRLMESLRKLADK